MFTRDKESVSAAEYTLTNAIYTHDTTLFKVLVGSEEMNLVKSWDRHRYSGPVTHVTSCGANGRP